MDARKNITRSILARIYWIDAEIASGKYPNAKYLAEKYVDTFHDVQASTATIHRDIDFMREKLHAPIEFDHQHNGFYYASKSFRLPAKYTDPNDLLALSMAKSLINLYEDTPLFEPISRILDVITAPLTKDEEAHGEQTSWYEKRIIVPPVASSQVDTSVWEIIIEGLRDNHLITFEYQGGADNEYNTRLVRPYQLLFDTGTWYLYGYSEERKATRMFSLPRMRRAALTNERFTLPKDYDYCAKSGGSYFGVFVGDKKQFKIWFAAGTDRYIKERQWASDQKIELFADDPNEGILISFTSTQFDKVLEWVLSFGARAFPYEPPELVAAWREHLHGMIECWESEHEGEEI